MVKHVNERQALVRVSKIRFGLIFAVMLLFGWIASSYAEQSGTALVFPPSEPEVFSGSLFVEQAAAESAEMQASAGEHEVEQIVLPGDIGPSEPDFQPGTWDPALDAGSGTQLAVTPEQFLNPSPSFEGISSPQTGFNPPDTQGDVGPNHYIQVVNSSFEIWDKDGNSLTGPTQINALWAGASDDQAACRDTNSGDPIVLYDHLADVWVITKFTRPNKNWQCIAVSRGPDPVNDGWYIYQFAMRDENGALFSHDYPKFGVWPDGYYMGSQEGFYGGDLNLMVFDRANMINGNPAGAQSLDAGNQTFFYLPSDLDGPPPPAGTPNYFARQVDSDHYGVGGVDRIEILEFHVDWANPANTGFSAFQTIPVLEFEETLCGGGNPGLFQYCIPQPGVTSQLEALTVWPMFKLQYRNHGDRDTLVFNHTVNADGNGTAGVRWYELERDTVGTGAWTLRQQGTYAPQFPGNSEPVHRFMGSVAMDKFGNMALGYSVSSENLVSDGDAVDGYPSIRYTGRGADAPLGLMTEVEVTLAQGTQSRDEDGGDGQVRWGDYSAMTVDPVDDCTFWYTQEYLTLGNNSWSTRVGAFSFSDCNADLSVTKTANPDPATAGEQITYTINVTNDGPLDATNVVVVDSLPAGFTYVADNVPGDQCDVAGQIITCAIGDIANGDTSSLTITALIESDILEAEGGPSTFDNLVEASAAQADAVPDNNSFTLSTLVNEFADLALRKVCKPDVPAVIGEEVGTCEIFVSNNGPSMARNVSLVDEIFTDGTYDISFIDAPFGASCSDVAGDVECDLGNIDAGEVVKVTVEVTPTGTTDMDINDVATVTSDTPDPDTSNNSDEGQINFIVATADLVVNKQCQPVTPAPSGTNATCEIFVHNNGPSTAVDVQLVDEIASDGSYTVTDISTAGAIVTSCPATPIVDGDVSCDLNDIEAGDTVSVTVTFTTNDEVDVNDIATATSETYDPDPNNNTDTGSVTFTGIANLSVIKSGNPPTVVAGTELTYTIEVDNAGPSAAVNVVVSDFLPNQAEFVSFNFTEGTGNCVAGEPGDPLQPTQCGMGTIASGDGATVEIVVFIRPDARGTLHNDVTVFSDTYDDDNSDNQVTENTGIDVETALVLTKTANLNQVAAGGELTYILSLVNNGPSTATDVLLVDELPPETSWVKTKVLGGVGDCGLSSTNPDIVTCTLDDMDPGEQFMVLINAIVDPSTPHGALITNKATASHAEGDDVNASVDTDIVAEADLWIDKTGLFLTENPSKTIRYTIHVHNKSGCSIDDPLVCGNGGPSDAQNVVVVDTLPATYKKLVVGFVSEQCQYFQGTHTVRCETPTLAAGDSVYYEIEATPRGRLRLITNTATVSSDTTDLNGGNNTDEWDIVVGGGGQK